MSKRLLALAAGAALAQAPAAAAGTIFLLSPVAVVAPPPPLAAASTALRTRTEVRVRGRVASSELVRVDVGPAGAPVRIAATQRLELDQTGDYFFVVPAPATSIVPGPGSQSAPGLRDVGIVWQGFADRHRVLSATVTLRPGPAARALPLRVRVRRRGTSSVVRLENATRRELTIALGRTTRAAVLGVLDRLRDAYRASGVVANLWQVDGQPGAQVKVRVLAPLRVRGRLAAGRSVDTVLDERSPARTFVVPGRARLRLSVELLPAPEILPARAQLAASPRPLLDLQRSLARIATAWTYRRYLDTPDPVGPSEAAYVYRSVPKPVAAVAESRRGGGDTLGIVLGAVLGAAGLLGLAVVWARS